MGGLILRPRRRFVKETVPQFSPILHVEGLEMSILRPNYAALTRRRIALYYLQTTEKSGRGDQNGSYLCY